MWVCLADNDIGQWSKTPKPPITQHTPTPTPPLSADDTICGVRVSLGHAQLRSCPWQHALPLVGREPAMRRGKGTVTKRRANRSNCIVHWEWELTKVNGEGASQLALVCRMSFLGTNFINNNDCLCFGQQKATFTLKKARTAGG